MRPPAWLRRFRRVRFIPQMELTECGAACLCMVLDHHGASVSLDEARRACGAGRDGVSAARIYKAATQLGLSAKAFRVEPGELAGLPLPAVLHWELNHFVVLEKVGRKAICIVDPAVGRRQLGAAAFSAAFTGVVLTFEPGRALVRKKRRSQSLARYFSGLRSLRSGWVSVLLSALLLEVLGLGFPAAHQVLIDHVLVPGRHGWFWPLFVIAGAVTATLLAVTALRDRVVRRLHFALDVDLMSAFVEHLLRLPLPFFQQRSTGDLLSRVDAQAELRDVALKALTAGLDALLILGYAGLMLAYDATIGCVILALSVSRVGILLSTRPAIARAQASQLAEQGKELSALVEPLAAPELVRAFGAQSLALERYEGRLMARLAAELRRDTLTRGTAELGGVLGGASEALVVYLAGRAVLEHQLTLGVFAGLVTLQGLIQKPMGSLVEALAATIRARGVLARIDDVLDAEATAEGAARIGEARGELAFEDVSFRYDAHGPLLCNQVSFRVAAGEKVAIVGRLGQGKTTLLRLIAGLLEPSSGQVTLDGVRLADVAPRELSRQMGVVLQEPFLMADTVRANLSLYWPEAPEAELWRAARLASVDEVIARLPAGLDTRLGDNGLRLSGGERQRLALARALVPSPRLLILDEATSSLDLPTEARVHANLAALGCTRVLVAHRMDTVRDADRILVVEGGRIVEEGAFEPLARGSGSFATLLRHHAEARA